MHKKIIVITILLFFLTMTLPLATGIKLKQDSDVFPVGVSRGEFNAELGFRGSENSFASLDGRYNTRGRFIGFSGTASVGDKQGRFRGFFRTSFIIINLPVSGRTLTIFGIVAFDQSHSNFRGLWRARGYRAGGWITGSLS
jgi:hypothetical protein